MNDRKIKAAEVKINNRIANAKIAEANGEYNKSVVYLKYFIEENNALSRDKSSIVEDIINTIEKNEHMLTVSNRFIAFEVKGICLAKMHKYSQVIDLYRSVTKRYFSNDKLKYLIIRLIKYLIRYGDLKSAKIIASEFMKENEKDNIFQEDEKLIFYTYFYYLEGKYDLFENYFQEIDKIINKNNFIKEEFIQISILASKRKLYYGEIKESIRIIKYAKERLFDLPRHYSIFLMLEGQLATIYSWTGLPEDTKESISILYNIIDIAEKIADKEYIIISSHNLGAVLLDTSISSTTMRAAEGKLINAISLSNIKENPENILIYVSLLDLYIRQGDFERLEEYLNEIVNYNSNHIALYITKAQYYLLCNNIEQIKILIEQIYTSSDKEKDFQIMNRIWWCQLYLEAFLSLDMEYDPAKIEEVLAPVQLNEKDIPSEYAHYRLVKGMYALAQDNYEEAMEHFAKSYELRAYINYTYHAAETLMWWTEATIRQQNWDLAQEKVELARDLLKDFRKSMPLRKRIEELAEKIPAPSIDKAA